MSNQQTDFVRRHFDRASLEWADRYGDAPRRMSDLDIQLRRENAHIFLQECLATGRQTKRNVLDVGCGPGVFFGAIQRTRVRVHGVDLSPEMIAVARQRNPEDILEVASATDLPFPDRFMDIIVCLGVLEYLSEPDAALREMQRVLAPNGALIVSFPNAGSVMRKLSRLEISLECVASRAWRRMTGRLSAPPEPTFAHRQWTLGQAFGLLRRSGFQANRVFFNTFGSHGRLGRLRLSLQFSALLSRHLRENPVTGRWLSSTMTCLASAIRP